MIGYLFPIVSSIALFELLLFLHIGNDATAIATASRECMRILLSSEIEDDDKEALVRGGSIDILKATSFLAAKLSLCGVIFYLMFRLVAVLFPALKIAAFESFFSPVSIAIFTAVVVFYAWVRKAVLPW
jgi:hypothetical protein